MITHVVLFKLKDRSPEAIKATARVLTSMQGRIPSLDALEVGIDQTHQSRSYDIALITRHQDAAGLDAYRTHPVHQDVLQHMSEVVETAAAVDYET